MPHSVERMELRPYRLSSRHPEVFTSSRSPNLANSSRFAGLWIPASAFRRGTRIVYETFHSNSATPSYTISIGGDGGGVDRGVVFNLSNVGISSPAWDYGEVQQETDGRVATFRQAGWRCGNAAAAALATATASVFIQPMNFVEFRATTATTAVFLQLTVIPGAEYRAGRPYSATLGV